MEQPTKEVEVKARVGDRRLLLEGLRRRGCLLSPPVLQKDRVFLPRGASHPCPPGTNVLRIREQENQVFFTLKQPQSGELDCIEKEMAVGDAALMAEIIGLLGYEETVRISKKRQTCRHQGMTLCLDEVEGLGTFIEVEMITDREAGAIQQELFAFLEGLGIRPEDRVLQGYDTLLAQSRKAELSGS